jgi:hypothetical protein
VFVLNVVWFELWIWMDIWRINSSEMQKCSWI